MQRKHIKSLVVRGFLGLEIIAFAAIYWYGAHGVQTLSQLRLQAHELETNVKLLQQKADSIEHELAAWNTHSFYKEKVAREQLQLAREGDIIFYMS